MLLCIRADVACCTTSDDVHFRPVNRGGAALLMVWSLESFKVIWTGGLTLDPFAIEADVSQTTWDSSHFFTYEVMVRSIFSTVVIGTW